MTKSKKILLSALALAGLATSTVAASCGGGNSELTPEQIKALPTLQAPALEAAKTEATEGMKIAIMMTDPENPRWKLATKEAEKFMKQAGFTNVIASQAKAQSDQNSWVKTQINADAKGVLLGASDKGASQIVFDAAKKGVPVVAYDRLIPGIADTYNWYTTFDNYLVGQYQGLSFLSGVYKYVVEEKPAIFKDWATAEAWINTHKLATKSIFYVVGGDADDNNAPLFYRGAMELVEKAQKLDENLVNNSPKTFKEVATPGWDYKIFKDLLTTNLKNLSDEDKKHFVGVVSPNDGMAEGAIQAIDSTKSALFNYKNITITGQDSNPTAYKYIKEGKQLMTIAKPDERPAQVASILMKAILAAGRKTKDITVEEAEAALKAANLGFTYKIVADDISYAVHNGKQKKFIKTVIIEPKIITSANVEEIKPAS